MRRSTAASPRTPLPSARPAMVFPEPSGKTLVPIVVQVRTNQLSFQVDQEKGTYTAQAAVVARLKDARGETVLTLSQQYILTGTDKELDAAKEGEILFYRQADLPPGVYGLEAIVFDALAERGSARLSTINVPTVSRSRLAASSLVLVRRAEQVPSGRARAESAVLLRRPAPVPEHGRAVAARHGRGADVLHLVLSRRGRCRRRDGGDPEQRTRSRVDAAGDASRLIRRPRPARRDAAGDEPARGHVRAAPAPAARARTNSCGPRSSRSRGHHRRSGVKETSQDGSEDQESSSLLSCTEFWLLIS